VFCASGERRRVVMADLSNVAWEQFPVDAKPDDLASPHFKFYELTKSDVASRHAINNAFDSAAVCRAAVYLCRNILEPVRADFGRFSPNSVYRCQAVERALKKKPADWVSDSQHTLGQACDIEVPGIANVVLARWVIDNLAFDQVILECYNAREGPNSGWVHVSVRPPGATGNRKEVLSYVASGTAQRYVYVSGLKETA
jgi:peptidase M15-like protein